MKVFIIDSEINIQRCNTISNHINNYLLKTLTLKDNTHLLTTVLGANNYSHMV